MEIGNREFTVPDFIDAFLSGDFWRRKAGGGMLNRRF